MPAQPARVMDGGREWRARPRAPYSAGVLPFAFDACGAAWFLLGRDARKRWWSDFGGKAEARDGGRPPVTAAREMREETCGALPLDVRDLAGAPHVVTVAPHTLGQPYHTFLLRVPLDHALPAEFERRARCATQACMVEKSELAWFPADQLLPRGAGPAPSPLLRPCFRHTVRQHADLLAALARQGTPPSQGTPPDPPSFSATAGQLVA